MAQAEDLFSDDFESGNLSKWSINTTDISVTSSSLPFGASNQSVFYNDDGTVNSGGDFLFKDLPAIDGIGTIMSFDYYEPDDGNSADLNLGYTATTDLNNIDTAGWWLKLNDGAITFFSGEVAAGTKTYSLDTAYRVYVVVNDTASAFSYSAPAGDAQNIASGEFDVYFQDLSTLTVTYAGTGVNDNTDAVSRFGFRNFNTGNQVVYLDNVVISTIPEPAQFALLFGGLALILGVMRRRKA